MPRCCGEVTLRADQVFSHGDEIVVGALAVLFAGRFMPGRAEFAPAADVGQDINPAALEPGGTDAGIIARQHGNLEAAVAIQQGRVGAIQHQVGPADLEIRHLGPVLRGGLVLGDLQTRGLEERRQTLELLSPRARQRAQIKARRREEIRDRHEVVVRFVRVYAAKADGAEGRRVQRCPRPLAVLVLQRIETVLHVVQFVDDQVVLGGAGSGQALAGSRQEQDFELPLALAGTA